MRTPYSEVREKATEDQYFRLWLEQARLVSSLLDGNQGMLVYWIFRLSKTKRYTAYDRFHRNSLYGKIPTKNELISALGSTRGLPCRLVINHTVKITVHSSPEMNDVTPNNTSKVKNNVIFILLFYGQTCKICTKL